MATLKQRLLYPFPAAIVLIFLAVAPLFMQTALISLFTKILIFALLAMSLDVAFGYTGLWSFCHAAIFGVAGYTSGILIIRYNIVSFWLVAPASVFMAVLVSAIFGLIGLRASGISFLLITFALGQLIYSAACKWTPLTGGFDGLGGIPYPNLGFTFTSNTFYYFTLVVVVICAILLHFLIKSPFGTGLQGIRECDTRMSALGYNVWLHKYLSFILSGLFGGISGILYVHFNGLITPESVGMEASGLAIIMIIIGGTGTLWGAAIGSAFLFVLEYYVSILTPERWPLILGVCFVAAVMFARGGIFPQLKKLWEKMVNYDRFKS